MHYTANYEVQLHECTKWGNTLYTYVHYTQFYTPHTTHYLQTHHVCSKSQNKMSVLSLSASCLLCNLVLYRVTVWNILEGGVYRTRDEQMTVLLCN